MTVNGRVKSIHYPG